MALRSPAAITSLSGVPVMGTSIGANIRTITSSTTALSSDTTIICNATSGAIILTLQPAAQNTGRIMGVKKSDSSANTVTVKGNNTELIDGANTDVLSAQFQFIFIHCDGTQWWVI